MWHGLTFTRTRLAPTPSGYLHLGNLASFILTCYIARQTEARILLRIDDLDQTRYRRTYLEDIFETLEFMELPWDEGPRNAEAHLRSHSQLARIKRYEEALTQLVDSGSVFACSCSRSQIKTFTQVEGYPGVCAEKKLPFDRPDFAWRLHRANTPSIEMHVAGGHLTKSDLSPDKYYLQVRKKDGAPSYHLATVVDDIHFKTDLIVRGNDLLDSSLAQLYLSGFIPPNQFQAVHFVHHPLILSPDGSKLSKSAGDTSIHALRKSGKTNRDVLNILGKILSADREFERWEELGEWMNSYWIKA